MLQPRDVFSGQKTIEVPQLFIKPNDVFWNIKIDDYAKVVKKAIESKIKNKADKDYLLAIIDYVNGAKVSTETLHTYSKDETRQIPDKKIITDFGEIIAPLFAVRYLDKYMTKDNVRVYKGSIKPTLGTPGDKVKYICFPTAQNYPIFDFFIKNGYYFGFSVKAMSGGSNTLAPKFIIERLDALKEDKSSPIAKKYLKEIAVLKSITDNPTYAGVALAFSELLKLKNVSGFKNLAAIKEIFAKTKFSSDATLLERNKNKTINKIRLSDVSAYKKFMDEYIIDDTKQSELDKQKYKSGKKQYTPENVVYGFIKYITSVDYDMEELLKATFQDLNITKVDLLDGVPVFKMQTIVEAKDTIQKKFYAFRSKAAFNRVNDKPGIQL